MRTALFMLIACLMSMSAFARTPVRICAGGEVREEAREIYAEAIDKKWSRNFLPHVEAQGLNLAIYHEMDYQLNYLLHPNVNYRLRNCESRACAKQVVLRWVKNNICGGRLQACQQTLVDGFRKGIRFCKFVN